MLKYPDTLSEQVKLVFLRGVWFGSKATNYYCPSWSRMIEVTSKSIQRARRVALRQRSMYACLPCKQAKTKCVDSRPCSRCKRKLQGEYCFEDTKQIGQSKRNCIEGANEQYKLSVSQFTGIDLSYYKLYKSLDTQLGVFSRYCWQLGYLLSNLSFRWFTYLDFTIICDIY